MTYWNLLEELTDLIEMYLRHHPAALRVLEDPSYRPSAEELVPLLGALHPQGDLGVRVDGGTSIPEAERRVMRTERTEAVILAAGGWPHIAAAVRDYRQVCPRQWAVLADHLRFVRLDSTRAGDGGQLQAVALRHGLSPDTVGEWRRRIPQEIARAVLVSAPDGAFHLIPDA